ncbi:hypothetical protein G9A89_008420 [Geosiphon pyriformis]|nr:hypothetical protein G9A89_008420 [Geosiphon pyriformis]
MGQSGSIPQSSGTEAAKYRHNADEQAKIRKDISEQAQKAYKSGNKRKAKDLSNKSKEHYRLMELYNKKAAEIIFSENNRHRNKDEIDLHGLFVKEALEYTEERIKLCKANRIDTLMIIVGKGNHSLNGIPKLKPAIGELVQKYQFRCTPNKPNSGCLYVEFNHGKGDLSWFDKLFGDNGCVIC